MFHMLAEAEPCPPDTLEDDGRHIDTVELTTLTAVILCIGRHSSGHRYARLNAFVDGLGHRLVHVELTPEDYDRAAATMQSPGTLVRGAGILVDDRAGPRLDPVHDLQFLAPGPTEAM